MEEKNGRYLFSKVYQRSWKMVSIGIVVMLLIFPLLACSVLGKVGVRGALIGMFISINLQFLTFFLQYLTIRDFRKSMHFGLGGFGIKIFLLIGALSFVYEHFPKECNTVIIVLLASIFVSVTVQARVLGSSRMLTVEPKMPYK